MRERDMKQFRINDSKKIKSLTIKGIILAVGLFYLLPLFWLLLCSLKTESEIFRVPVVIFPSKLYLEPYIDQLSGSYNMFRSFFNSFIISFSTMLLSVGLSTFAAYGLARFKIKGKNIFMSIVDILCVSGVSYFMR